MSAVRVHHYSVAEDNVGEFRTRRAAAIDAIRAKHPGLTETRLIRLDDGTYTDTWRWTSVEAMVAAFGDIPTTPETGAAMSLTQDGTAQNGEIVDER